LGIVTSFQEAKTVKEPGEKHRLELYSILGELGGYPPKRGFDYCYV